MSAEEEARRKLEKPVVGTAKAASLALELFGLTAEPDSLKELDSYDDRNFLLRTATGEQFVLKVHNGVESQVPAFIEAQNEAMGCVRNLPGLWCPWPCLSVHGNPIENAELSLPDGSPRRHAVRCLPFLPARLLGDVAPTCELLTELGGCAARLDQALTAVTHQAAWREHAWDLRSTCELEGLVQHLEPWQLDTVRAVIDEFRQEVLPCAASLPSGVIHCDLNDQNVLVDEAGEHIVGVIDFGDLVYSWQVNELAICAAYVLIYLQYDKHVATAAAAPPSPKQSSPAAAPPQATAAAQGVGAAAEGAGASISPVLALRWVCRAYHAERTLSEAEWRCLPTLVSSRLAMSLTIGMFSAAQDPDNEYLRLTLRPAWQALQLMRGRTAREWSELLQTDAVSQASR